MPKSFSKIKEKVKNLPNTSGIYLMKDQNGQIIYVGKAKNLKQRVQSYFQKNQSHSNKVLRMIFNIADFDYVEVDTELDALLLECQLIQQHHPMYNRQMNAATNYNYLTITENGLHISTEPLLDSYGPFRLYKQLEPICESLSALYQMPWVNEITRLKSEQQYPNIKLLPLEKRFLEIRHFFSGTSADYAGRISEQIDLFAENQQYEKAQLLAIEKQQLDRFYEQITKIRSFTEEKERIFALPLTDQRMKYYQMAYGEIIHTEILPNTAIYHPIARETIPKPLTKFSLDPLLILLAYIKKTSEKD